MQQATNRDEFSGARSADQGRGSGNDLSNAENQAVNQTHRAQSGIKQVGLNFKRALDHSTADEPAATLALAAVFGFVLGALWKA